MIRLWFSCAVDMTLHTLEAQRVVALRMAAMASGGAKAQAEAQRMVTEKIVAAMRTWPMIGLRGSPVKALGHYRSRVRANERRLSRRK
jgi:hypothetical protein